MELLVRSLIKISLVGFLLSFVLIFYIENNFELEAVSVDSITIKELEKNVRVEEEIVSSRSSGGNVFIEIEGNDSSMKGVIFNSNSTPTPNNDYSIEGVVKYYKGDIELVVNKIESIENKN